MKEAGLRGEEALRGILSLQRALALDGRNALARIELAASELQRLALSPAGLDRIASIRDAVGEIDDFLDRIERIAEPMCSRTPAGVARLEPILESIRMRIAPIIASRGMALVCAEQVAGRDVALPAPVVERMLLMALRACLSLASGRTSEDGAGRARIVLSSRDEGESIAVDLAFEPWADGGRLSLACGARVELDVALAEWSGLARFDEADARLTLWMPAEIGKVEND